MCCKRKGASSRRSAIRNGQNKPEEEEFLMPPPNAALNDFPPPANQQKSANGKYDIAILGRNESLIMPAHGKGALQRVFLGVGWKADVQIDVDCVCAPFSKGVRAPDDTVWWRNTKSSVKERKAEGSWGKKNRVVNINHTGDVLFPQNGKHELEDMERIYVDLENLDSQYDCLGFESNVFSAGMTFGDLSHAYVRLVNADTNQEICRSAVDRNSATDKQLMSKSVLLLAKLYREKDRYVIKTCMEPREKEQKLENMIGVHPEFMLQPQKYTSKTPKVIPAPEPEKIIREEKESGGGYYMMGAVAVGSAAGIAAAIMLFNADGGGLSVQSMGSPAITSAFEVMSIPGLPTDCGCCADIEVFGCCNLGDAFGSIFDFCNGGLCDLLGCAACNPCALCQPVVSCIEPAVAQVGNCASGLLDGCGGIFASCGFPIGALCGTCGDCGGICTSLGSLARGAGDVCTGAVGGIGGCVSKVPDLLGPIPGCSCCISEVGHALNGFGGNAVHTIGEFGGNAVHTIGEFGGNAVHTIGDALSGVDVGAIASGAGSAIGSVANGLGDVVEGVVEIAGSLL